jgi:sugar lactone lactonase YvrE
MTGAGTAEFACGVAVQRPSSIGEGCSWDVEQRRLYWVDILENQVFVHDPSDGSNLAFDVRENVGSVAVARNGKLLLALRHGFAVLDPTTGALSRLGAAQLQQPGQRFNDGKCDPAGRFWAGTMVEHGSPGTGALYCVATDLSFSRKLEGLSISNGLVWNSRGDVFYHTDTPTRRICAFDYDVRAGQISGRRVVGEIPGELGLPDGMTIDTQGQLWVALWGGGKVVRLNPATSAITWELAVPAKNVTSCSFGGPELNELYITTASVGMTEAERAQLPLAGSLFRVRLPFTGLPTPRFDADL